MAEILTVKNLVQEFQLSKGFLSKIHMRNGRFVIEEKIVRAVNGVSFSIAKGEVFGLVGESGCGKSTTARTIVGLNKATGGSILFDGVDIQAMDKNRRFQLHKKMQMIFQDPYASLHPRMTVLDAVMEPILFHRLVKSKQEAMEHAYSYLERVGIRKEQVSRYPHQFSGGQRQRIGIARALAVDPAFLIADEPVSALDVSIQAQILNLMMDLKEEFQLSYLFIAHNLSVVRHICNRLGIMYLGRIVEMGSRDQVFENPAHPYTSLLLSVSPTLRGQNIANYQVPEGEVPNVLDIPKGCAFAARCKHAAERCSLQMPEQKEIEPGHVVSCWQYE